jgi:hypothetical protein
MELTKEKSSRLAGENANHKHSAHIHTTPSA